MRDELTLQTTLLTLLFWSCIGGIVIAQDYKLQSVMRYAEQPLRDRASLVSPDSRIFLAMPNR
jgi:hypothetical protein